VIKSGGEWISSVDLENCACGHPDVLMAAAIGVRHPKWEERPLLLVVPRQGCRPARDSVLAHIAEHFAKWQLPDDVIVVESLPMTATGKISKKDLRAKYRDYLMK
jgi:fatty-acyl-CoA synthase